MKKIIIRIVLSIIVLSFALLANKIYAYTQAPSFDNNFANYLTDKTPDEY
jgi:hypothetical protein